jgi:hypothetical protein
MQALVIELFAAVILVFASECSVSPTLRVVRASRLQLLRQERVKTHPSALVRP